MAADGLEIVARDRCTYSPEILTFLNTRHKGDQARLPVRVRVRELYQGLTHSLTLSSIDRF
jgi:hypothetical protein